jgi:death-on-curing protein
MRYLTVADVVRLHRKAIQQSGGSAGVRDAGALESAVAQPRAAFGGEVLYPTLVEKAAALAFSLVMNHPFVDGNKRAGHAALETMLVLNGHELDADVDEAEAFMLRLASGEVSRAAFLQWLRQHVVVRKA